MPSVEGMDRVISRMKFLFSSRSVKIAKFYEYGGCPTEKGHDEASHFAGKTKEGMTLEIIQEALACPDRCPKETGAWQKHAPAHEAPWRRGKTLGGSERRAFFKE